MKKTLTLLLLLIFSVSAFSQEKPRSNRNSSEFWEMIRTKRIAVFTDIIGLTPSEAQKFWPLYNAFDKERINLMSERRMLEKNLEGSKTGLTDADYRKIANDFVATHVKEAQLMEIYNTKYLEILPAEKVCKLYHAERKFREMLMHELRANQGTTRDR